MVLAEIVHPLSNSLPEGERTNAIMYFARLNYRSLDEENHREILWLYRGLTHHDR